MSFTNGENLLGFSLMLHEKVPFEFEGKKYELEHGSVCIAAITSCTNTSNPDVMIAAGLLAKKVGALNKQKSSSLQALTGVGLGSREGTDGFPVHQDLSCSWIWCCKQIMHDSWPT